MVYNREEAAKRAEAQTHNTPGTCQLWTRTQFGAPSAGDRDRDGDADAVDGWKSEPDGARHTDRNPPRGVPVAFVGGSRGYGHRAVSLGGGKIRSTDMDSNGYRPGRVGTTTISQIERSMGVKYVGWSETITGIDIPLPKPPAPPKPTRGAKVDKAVDDLTVAEKRAKDGLERDTKIKKALRVLQRIPYLGGKKR